jgi:hypothetical protein
LAVPSLYLLGCRKCGTTSFAKALRGAGIQMMSTAYSARGTGEKEWRFFDSYCNTMSKTGAGCTDVVVDAAMRDEFGKRNQNTCDADLGTVADATPDNLHLPGLAMMLNGIYQVAMPAVSFVLLLREPMSRMQSDFYFCNGCKPFGQATFSGFVEELEAHLPDNYTALMDAQSQCPTGDTCIMKIGGDYNHFYSSLYALQMRQWLQDPNLQGSQFFVMPSFWATSFTRDAVEVMATQFPALTLNVSAVPAEADHLMSGNTYPPLEEDLDIQTRQRLQKRFFDPDADALSLLLEKSMAEGLTLGGFDPTQGMTASLIKAHLTRWWKL